MINCPFCNRKILYGFSNYLGLCQNHNIMIKFYSRFNLIEFHTNDYILCHYPDKVNLLYKDDYNDRTICSAIGSFNVTPDNANSIIQKLIKYNAFF